MESPLVDHGLCRYAVLHHWGIDEPHYDLLFETEPNSLLQAFRLGEWPLPRSQPVTKLRDHRRLYLTYEGAVPGDRGRVDRVAEGIVRVLGGPAGWRLLTSEGALLLTLEPEEADVRSDRWRVSVP